ncbi:MAG: fibronectin type III domain-containing protein [Clostridia bacterium]|nr:fibronectin type III domain-containing protein [Clostridia bacterium]
MKKTLCLLLSTLMLLSALPFVAFGASTIGLVELIGLVPPTENAYPNWYITDNDPDYEVVYVEWFDNETGLEMDAYDKFVAGHSYAVVIWVETQNNFVFDTTVRGDLYVRVTNNYEEIHEVYELTGSNEQMKIRIDYAPFESKLVSEVAVTGIDAPAPGKTPDYTGVVDSECYKIDEEGIATIEWYDITDGESAPQMPENEKFVADHKYRVCVWLRAINGYQFITDADLAVSINGNAGEHLNESSVVAYVSYDFAPCKIDASACSASLSTSSCTYNGKVRTPSVTVKDSEGNLLVKDTDYTVTYPDGRKNPGKYVITVEFKGDYSGTKELDFTILPKAPAASDISATQSTSVIKLSWKASAGATGYRVYQYSPSKGKYVQIASIKTTTYRKATNLKAGTEYKFKIKPYTKLSDGTVLWGTASAEFATATECKAPAITSVASTAKSKATVKWSNVSGESGYQLYYSTKKTSGYKKVNSYAADKLAGSKTFSSSASGKTIYFKVRAYKKVNGQTIFSEWSAVKSVKLR